MSHVRYGYLFLKALLITTLFSNISARAASPEEQNSWIAANVVGTREAFQSFLENYPTSAYAEKAFAALANKIPAKPPKAVPAKPPAKSPPSSFARSGAGATGVY